MKRKIVALVVSVIFLTLAVMPPCGYAQVLPEGYTVVNGDVMVIIDGQTMNIKQASQQAITEWVSFCIANGYTVNINQPGASSFSLNRVTGGNPSQILGNLFSNGQVFLVNPNGVLFGPGSSVNAPGLVASTLDISNDDFLGGKFIFSGKGSSVVSQGQILSPGGYVALLGNRVENAGAIVSELGTVALGSGSKITLGLDAGSLISVVVNEAATASNDATDSVNNANAILNTGTISANGGTVILTAKALNGIFSNAINNQGIIEATDIDGKDGKVVLSASGSNANISSSGTITGGDVTATTTGDLSVRKIIGDSVDLSANTIQGLPIMMSEKNPSANIIADTLKLSAANGIGLNTSKGLLTDVNTLYAYNNGTGGIRITDIAGDLNVVNALASGSGGNVSITSSGNMTLGHVLAFGEGNTATLKSDNGSILDGNGSFANITADNIVLSAKNGIGSSTDAIEARSASPWINSLSLTANNSTIGGIYVDGLSANMDILSVVNNGGDVRLSSAGSMGISEIFSSNNVQLTANTIINSLPSAGVNVTANSLTLSAMNGIGLNTESGLLTDVNNLSAYNYGTGGIRITDIAGDLNVINALASGSGGDVSIISSGNMTLGHVLAFGQGNTATLISNTGSIFDGNGNLANITADNIVLSAATGIGAADNFLDMRSASAFMGNDTLHVQAANSNSGGIYLNGMSTSSAVPLNFYADSIVNNGGDVAVTSAGNLWVGYVEGQDVTLNALSGFISDAVNDSDLDIKADMLKLFAYNGIGVNTDLGLIIDAKDLIASTAFNGIKLTDINDLNIKIADALNGSINITSEGDMRLGDSTFPDIFGIKANATYGSVTLTSNNGAIIDGNGSNWNIEALNIFLNAKNGIGSNDAIEVHTEHLSAHNTTSGSIRIKDLNTNLYVDSVVNEALNGSVYLTAAGDNNSNPGWDDLDMYVKSVVSKNGVYLESTKGAILDNNGSALNIDSLSTELIAFRGIGSADALETRTNILDFRNISLGNVNIDNMVNTLGGNLQLGDLYAWNTGSGNITVRELIGSMTALDVRADNGFVDLFSEQNMSLKSVLANGLVNIETANGDIIFGGPGFSTGRVESLTSGVNLLADNGSVLVQTTQTTPHIIAKGDSYIRTPHGKITPTGTPLDVNIDGNLYVDLTNSQISNVVNAPIPPPMDIFGNMTGIVTGSITIPFLLGTNNPAPLTPPGYVYYNGVQIWPPKMIDSGERERISASTEKIEKAYWEILNPSRYVSVDPATRTFYQYHPLGETDDSAFTGINLDADAYEFIEENINLKKDLDPYFGWLEDQKKEEGQS